MSSKSCIMNIISNYPTSITPAIDKRLSDLLSKFICDAVRSYNSYSSSSDSDKDDRSK